MVYGPGYIVSTSAGCLRSFIIALLAPKSALLFRAKNSYSIERRPIDYVPTATLGSCCGRVPCCKSCKLKQSELKLNL
eukprot:7722-Heterococcus_DN1.PRE.1